MKAFVLEKLVQAILEKDLYARKDDFYLAVQVYKNIVDMNYYKGIYDKFEDIPFNTLMLDHKTLKLPAYESIPRARRNVFELYPELIDSTVQYFRNENQNKFIAYSQGYNVEV